MYERVGGDAWFAALVERFYAGVADDPVLRPLYPDDLGPSKAHLAGFLIQYWGGPTTYSERARPPSPAHAARAVRHRRRRSAMPGSRHMAAAVRDGRSAGEDEAALLAYFEMAATHLMNAPELTIGRVDRPAVPDRPAIVVGRDRVVVGRRRRSAPDHAGGDDPREPRRQRHRPPGWERATSSDPRRSAPWRGSGG